MSHWLAAPDMNTLGLGRMVQAERRVTFRRTRRWREQPRFGQQVRQRNAAQPSPAVPEELAAGRASA
jgi:hypothetical protein